jgi:hypothetical protein
LRRAFPGDLGKRGHQGGRDLAWPQQMRLQLPSSYASVFMIEAQPGLKSLDAGDPTAMTVTASGK